MRIGPGGEFKGDGVRAIAYVSGDEVRLLSRNDQDMAASYPAPGPRDKFSGYEPTST